MKMKLNAFLFLLVCICSCNPGSKQNPNGADGKKIFKGKWTYRSLLNNNNVNTDFDSLAFAAATISLSASSNDSLTGQILWAIDSAGTQFNGLNLFGRFFYNDTTLCYHIQGFGDSLLGTAGWQYDYQGYLVPHWPNGVNQDTVLVGSVIRVRKHSCDSAGKNCAPAGVVASTYMVKHN